MLHPSYGILSDTLVTDDFTFIDKLQKLLNTGKPGQGIFILIDSQNQDPMTAIKHTVPDIAYGKDTIPS